MPRGKLKYVLRLEIEAENMYSLAELLCGQALVIATGVYYVNESWDVSNPAGDPAGKSHGHGSLSLEKSKLGKTKKVKFG